MPDTFRSRTKIRDNARASGPISENPAAERVKADVLTHIQLAARAVNRQDMAGMAEGLAAAVALYEQHPSHVHQPTSQLSDLLMCIRAARALCHALGCPDHEMAVLEARAAVLRQPLH